MHAKILRRVGLEIFAYKSTVDEMRQVFLLVRAPISLLRRYAADIKYNMLLDPKELQVDISLYMIVCVFDCFFHVKDHRR